MFLNFGLFFHQSKGISILMWHIFYWYAQEDWVLCRVFYKNREVAANPSMGNCYDDTGSSTLPALMDSYINFDRPQTHADEYEQVPCFSIFDQNQTSPFFTHMTNMEPNVPTTKIYTETTFKGIPNNIGTCLDPFPSDAKVLKAVLSQLSNIDSNPNMKGSPSLGEGSSESYLSEVGLPNIWSHFWFLASSIIVERL